MTSRSHIHGLDGVRALAVTGVVWHHTYSGTDLPVGDNGFLGVDLFFVLSGFLITKLLLEERRAAGRIALGSFYARRSLRIFPLYFAVLALLALYAFASGGSSALGAAFLADLPFHATYTSNWVPVETLALTWSLSTEEQFYLLWPPLLVALAGRSLLVLLPFLGLNQLVNFGALDRWLAAVGLPYESLSILQCTFTPIVLGVLVALALDSAALQPRLRRVIPAWTVVLGSAVLIAIALYPGEMRGWPRLLFHLAAAATIAAIAVHQQHFIVKALEWRPLRYVGAISYGIYLLHILVADVVLRVLGDGAAESGAAFLPTLALTIVLAGLSYRFFERPFLRLKNRFR